MQGKSTRRLTNGDSKASAGASDDQDDNNNNGEQRSEKAILEICVTDTGIGIPADRLPRLFKSFSQIDISTARRYGGTGLGLAISSTLVNRMGGGLWVESEEGIGSKFALTLPMTVAPGRPTRNFGSESTTTSSFITSPPSPSSSISDGSSVHSGIYERSDSISSHSYNTASPALSAGGSGYFPPPPPSSSSSSSNNYQQQSQQSLQQQNGSSPSHRLRHKPSWSLFNRQNQNQNQNQQSSSTSTSNQMIPPDYISDHGMHPLLSLSTSPPNHFISSSSTTTTNMASSFSTSFSSPIHTNMNSFHSDYLSLSTNRAISPIAHLQQQQQQQQTVEMKTADVKRPLLRRGDASYGSSSNHYHVNNNNINNNNNNNNNNSSTGNNNNNNNINVNGSSPTPTISNQRNYRTTLSKSHHSRNKSVNSKHEENFALTYPVKILLAEDNICKFQQHKY